MSAAKVIGMADPLTPDAFYASAQEFALSALEAHYAGNHRRVPLFAGTAVEHLAKACLAQRSPALLIDLRQGSSFNWLVALLRLEGSGVPGGIRTVGLTEVLNRIGRFVKSKADKNDLQTLVHMRNGVVHAAEDAEVEERILSAFVQQADALLEDLGRARKDFWSGQLSVVNALVKDASDKVKLRVEVRLAAAEAMINGRYETEGETVISALRALSRAAPLTHDQRFRDCPVCGSEGIATGEHDVDWFPDDWDKDTGEVTNVSAEVWFNAQEFRCPVCNLRLDSEAEISAAGIATRWQIEDADWRDYEEPMDEDAIYEHYRAERDGL